MENKDCTGCWYAVIDDIRDEARCYCSNLEIHIFNPEPFYCSDWAPKEGQHSTDCGRNVEDGSDD